MSHTWSTAERKAAKRFAASLPDERLETARDLTGRSTADDVIDLLARHKQDLSRVAETFRPTKPDIVKFLKNERGNKADLRLTVLSTTATEELKVVLKSYFTQGWQGSAKDFLTERAKKRDEDAGGQERVWSDMKRISFKEPAMAQIRAFLLRVSEEERVKLYQKLAVTDEAFSGSREQQVQTLLSIVEGEKGPYTLLNAMEKRHVRIFLIEHWQQIAKDNFGEGTDEDYIDYDIRTCQLCILWGWAHM